MSDNSKIEWTDATWNPVRGCSRVSEGCRNCYAERVAARFSGPGMPYEGLATRSLRVISDDEQRVVQRWTGVVRFVPEKLAEPLHWKKPRRVFVNSMSDLFHDDVTNQQIAAVFGVMAATPRHTYQVLTKRARRMREWFRWASGMTGVNLATGELSRVGCDPLTSCVISAGRLGTKIRPADMQYAPAWPLANVWIGVSVENQAAAEERIPELLATPAAVRWISAEPLIGPVDLRVWTSREHGLSLIGAPRGLAWVVSGCESGPGARPCDVAWLRSLRDQCAAAGVSYFLKQAVATPGVGVLAPSTAPHEIVRAVSPTDRVRFTDAVTAGPGSHRKAGGVIGLPYLDGVQHAALPGVDRV